MTVEIRLGLALDTLELEVLAVHVERLDLFPDALDDVEPFFGIGVSAVVILQGDAEHVEFAGIPAGDDIESEAPLSDVVGGDDLLRRENRIDERDVERAEHAN